MEAGAAVRALHPTVTSEEVTAHAEGEAVRLVLTEELGAGHGDHPGGGRGVAVVVDQALRLLQVSNER